ncbi:MAG: hypothetical protein EA364_06880 [Balneolaceae bacterium]|nr:MAG: hypothetical protein EA364_06880 [Balneolaceae bacterium]
MGNFTAKICNRHESAPQSRNYRFGRSTRQVIRCLTAIFLIFVSGLSGVRAQTTVQVNVLGVPPVLTSPFVTELESNFRTGLYRVQLNVINVQGQPVDMVFRIQVVKDGRVLVEETSRPVTYEPGIHLLSPFFEQVRFERREQDIFADLDRQVRNQVLQSGALPEGNYMLNIEAQPTVTGQTFSGIPGVSNFLVRYPQPPQLLTPPDRSTVAVGVPMFTWTPVLAPAGSLMEYEILLVQMFDGQNPGDAILSNREHARETISNMTILPYTGEFLPLEKGNTYAWQVTATGSVPTDLGDAELPVKNEGRSEIYTFTYSDDLFGSGDLDQLLSINLIPGLAVMTDLEQLDITDSGTYYTLNGPATVRFNFTELDESITVRSAAQNLTILKSDLNNPVITGGRVDISIDRLNRLLLGESTMLSLSGMRYEFGLGITTSASIETQAFGLLDAAGQLDLTPGGLRGTLTATGQDLFRFEGDHLSLSVDQVSVTLPEQHFSASAGISVLGMPSPCRAWGLDLDDTVISSNFQCFQPFGESLGGDPARVDLQFTQMSGSFMADTDDGSLEYEIEMSGAVRLDYANTEPCGMRLAGSMGHDTAPEFDLFGSTCRIPSPELDLGFARIGVRSMDVDRFAYDPASGGWDFGFSIDPYIKIPVFDNWTHEPGESVTIDRQGVHLPAMSVPATMLPEYRHSGLRVKVTSLSSQAFTFPWYGWDGLGAGPWPVSFGANAWFVSATEMPACLRTMNFEITDGRIQNDRLRASAVVSSPDPDGIACPIGPGGQHTLKIGGIQADLMAEFQPEGPELSATLAMQSLIESGYPVSCAEQSGPGQQARAQFQDQTMELTGRGFSATFSNIHTGCDMRIGPFSASIGSSTLHIGSDRGVFSASLSADASLKLSETESVSGSFSYDLVSGEFTGLDFRLDQPFIWAVPPDDPVLSFRINEAVLNLDGFSVDGRQRLLLGTDEMGVTFDELVIDLNTSRITSGRILFDQSFGLMAGFEDGLDSPRFRAVPEGFDPGQEQGLHFELGGRITADTDGLRAEGTASASLSVQELTYSNAEVQFSDNFSMSLIPFAVNSGYATLLWDEVAVAFLDASGLNPVISGLAENFLPDRLPLPSLDAAWLQLRDSEGTLLVDIQQLPENRLRLLTRPGQPLDLYLPFLNAANPPVAAGVNLEDVIVSTNPGHFRVLSGMVSVDVPLNNPAFDLEQYGLPFIPRSINYGFVEAVQDHALQIYGDVKLFGRQLTEQGEAVLRVLTDAGIIGEFDFDNLDVSVPFVEQLDKILLEIDRFSGAIQLPNVTQTPSYQFNIGGHFRINAASPAAALAEIGLSMTPGGISLESFHPVELGEPFPIVLGGFDLKIDAITSIPVLHYAPESGWDFAVDLDAHAGFELRSGDRFELPLQGLMLSKDAFSIPAQNFNTASTGLRLPEIDLDGVLIRPLAIRSTADISFNWVAGEVPTFSPVFDFELQLPALDASGIIPPEGLSLVDVTFADGYLSGELLPFSPLGGAPLSLGTESLTAVILRVEDISGILTPPTIPGDPQMIDIMMSGTIDDFPIFTGGDAACQVQGSWNFRIAQGHGFEGLVEDLSPCGSISLGPLDLGYPTASLELQYTDDVQKALLSGVAQVSLEHPNPGNPPVQASGSLTVDLMTGRVDDGEIAINQPFRLELPATGGNPLLPFTVNSAILNRDGLRMNADGELRAGGSTHTVAFNNLLLSLPDFSIAGGSAVVQGGFGLELGLSPLDLALIDYNAPLPDRSALRFTTSASVVLDASGLNYSGTGNAQLVFNDETFGVLRVEFHDDFAMSIYQPRVSRGRAEFYLDLDGPAAEPIAILDVTGLSVGGGLIAMLPDRIGLPSEDIAYVQIKDAAGEPLVSFTDNGSGGYTVTSGDQFLPVVFPALQYNAAQAPEAGIRFTLNTDGTFNPNGGTIEISGSMDLQPVLGIPLSVDSLGLDSQNGLTVRLAADLPPAFGNQPVRAQATVNSSGFVQAVVEAGTYVDQYSPGTNLMFESTVDGSLGASTEAVHVGIYGARIMIGAVNEMMVSGTFKTSFFEHENQLLPLFFKAGYSGGQWQAEAGNPLNAAIQVGFASILLDEEAPVGVSIASDRLILSLNGRVNFSEALGEDLEFSFENLEVGVENLQSDPRPVFRLGQATAHLGSQTFDFFNGTLTGTMNEPSITISGRSISAASSSGQLTFMDRTFGYQNIDVSSTGNFTIGSISSGNVQIIGEYLVLQSLGMSVESGSGLELDATFGFFVPDPVDQEGQVIVKVSREANNSIKVESGSPNIELNQKIAMGSLFEFKLTGFDLDLNVQDLNQTALYASGVVLYNNQERIWFGEAGNLRDKPGIGIKLDNPNLVSYNATGKGEFKVETGLLNVYVNGNAVASDSEQFRLVLGGSAELDLPGVSGDVGYEGMVVTREGIVEKGNFTGAAEFTFIGIMKLTVGTFLHRVEEQPFTIQVAPFIEKPTVDQPGTVDLDVVELLCFGPCPAVPGTVSDVALRISFDGSGEGDNGSFSAFVDRIMYYRTANNDISLYIDNAGISLSSIARINASLHYEQSGGDFLFRAAGSARIAGITAMMAGKFANVGDELSFGIFVAVGGSTGIPIAPGINLTAVGGGFFYRPVSEDIAFVQGALSDFGYKRVKKDPIELGNNVKFAAMLYAEVGIGAGTKHILSGKTFIMVASGLFYMDVRGHVLGMDGTGTIGTKLEGSMFVEFRTDPFLLIAGIGIEVRVRSDGRIVKGDADITFALAREGGEQGSMIFALMGKLDISLVSSFNATADILASNDGFYIDASLGLDLLDGIPLVSVSGTIKAAVWYIPGHDKMPFGAYGTAEISLTLVITVSAQAAAAFVRRDTGFELFISAKGCIGAWKFEKCAAAWFLISPSGIDWGRGAGAHGDILAQAEALKNQFRQSIMDTIAELNKLKEALEALPQPELTSFSPEELAKAGIYLYSLPTGARSNWVQKMRSNESNLTGVGYSELDNLLGSVTSSNRPGIVLDMSYLTGAVDPYQNAIEHIDEVVERLQSSILLAIEFDTEAEELLDDVIASFDQTPVQNFTKGSINGGTINPGSFTVNDDIASEQAESMESYRADIQRLEQQFIEAISTVEQNVTTMASLLGRDDPPGEVINIGNLQNQMMESNVLGLGGTTSQQLPKSVNAISQIFTHALETTDRRFAIEANSVYRKVVWAMLGANAFSSRQQSLTAEADNVTNRFQTAFDSRASDATSHLNTYFERRNIMHRLLDGLPSIYNQNYNFSNAHETVSSEHDSLMTYFNNPLSGNLNAENRNKVQQNNRDFWFNMHRTGLQGYASRVLITDGENTSTFDDLVKRHHNRRKALIDAHMNTTGLIDQYYTIKSSVMSNLYHLIDTYLTMGEFGGLDSETYEQYDQRRTEIASLMQPPVIGSMSISGSFTAGSYLNTGTISWDITYPGRVSETAIMVRETNSPSPLFSEMTSYFSVGTRSSFAHSTYKNRFMDPLMTNNPLGVSAHNTNNVTVSLRVRGESGVTGFTSSTFSLQTGVGGTQTATTTELVSVSDTPPGRPTIILWDYYRFVQTSDRGSLYWTSDENSIRFKVRTNQSTSDIQRVEYAVGTTQGGTDVIDWSPFIAPRTRISSSFPRYDYTGRTGFLQLQEETPYYISVRVYSSNDLVSPVANSLPVYLDTIEPTKPGNLRIGIQMPTYWFFAMGETPLLHPLINEIPLNPIDPETTDRQTPNHTLSWNAATDNVSGIWKYEYAITQSAEPNDHDFKEDQFTSSLLKSFSGSSEKYAHIVDYITPVYLHVRSVNNAGLRSDISSIGPYKPADMTRPTVPEFRTYVSSGTGFLLPNDIVCGFITREATDPETGITGYQFSIGTSPGADDVRPWPGAGDIDAFSNEFKMNTNNVPNHLCINKSEFPEGQNLYLNTRALNGQNMASRVVSSGPFLLDSTPPVIGSVNFGETTILESDGRITINNTQDPESGIVKIEYRIINNSTNQVVIPWTTNYNAGPNKYTFNRNIYVNNPGTGGFSPSIHRAEVRVTNAMGLQSISGANFFRPISIGW